MQNTDLEYYIIKSKKILAYYKEITKHHAQYAKQHALPHPEQKQGHPSDPVLLTLYIPYQQAILIQCIPRNIIAYIFLLNKRKFCDIIKKTTVLQGGVAFIPHEWR